MPEIAHKSSSRRSTASIKGPSVKKDLEHQTLTLMPVDQSIIAHRRITGTNVKDQKDDGEMPCFSPTIIGAPVTLQGMKSNKNSRSGAATQSIDRTAQHMKIT